MSADETRDGVELTHLDQPLFDGADATKRQLVDYVDAMSQQLVGALDGRPLSVIRVRAGQARSCRRTCRSTRRTSCGP
jgi:DNA primase